MKTYVFNTSRWIKRLVQTSYCFFNAKVEALLCFNNSTVLAN